MNEYSDHDIVKWKSSGTFCILKYWNNENNTEEKHQEHWNNENVKLSLASSFTKAQISLEIKYKKSERCVVKVHPWI